MARSITTALAASLVGASLLAPATASAKWVFPYNHPDLKWYTIETEHFYVHYPISKKSADEGNPHYIDATWAARKMATVADEMWEPMCAEFDYYLKEKVHIVLLEQPDDLEGFTVPAWDWIEVSANPGAYFYRMRGRMEWFSDVLVHEFAHVVSLKQNAPFTESSFGVVLGGLMRDGVNNQQDGAQIFIGDTDPTFWTEGGAEYWSDNSGYNWWTPSRDLTIRASVYDERLLSCDDWLSQQQGSDWSDGERRYQQGYSFALYLRERFGDETYARFAQVSSQGWRADWTTILEEVTGVDMCTLHGDWVKYLEAKYDKLREDVRDRGETVGQELKLSPGKWEYTDPDGRDAWYADWDKTQQRWEKERSIAKAGGTWDGFAKVSDDGKWIGEQMRGMLSISKLPEGYLPGINGGYEAIGVNGDVMQEAMDYSVAIPTDFMHEWDFIPGRDAVVITDHEQSFETKFQSTLRMERDGYNWNKLWVVDFSEPVTDKRKHRGGKEEYQHLQYKNDELAKRATAIPNTERGSTPIVSPDGTKVAYLEYASGTQNLVLINLDGTEKRYLTDFHDGAWMQIPDWSPDGTKIVIPIFRNYQQDLYIIDVATGEATAITRDRWEEMDCQWTDDGILFSADATGVFNIYKYDLETKDVTQITNVIRAAEMPWMTPEGNLLFTNLTGHGWRNWTLAGDELMNMPVDYFNTKNIDADEVKAELAYSEDLSYWEEHTKPYRAGSKHWIPLQFIPVFSLENDSRTNIALQGGMQVFAFDFVEYNNMFIDFQLGEDAMVRGAWTFDRWAPSITLFALHGNFKFDYAYLLDGDNNLDTTNDQTVFDGKNHQYLSMGAAFMSYKWNDLIDVSAYFQGLEYGFKGTSDTAFNPYMRSLEGGVGITASTLYPGYTGTALDLTYGHAWTDMVFRSYQGHDTDDGEILDQYQYNRYELNLTREFHAPTFGMDKLSFIQEDKHVVQLNASVGYIDRNVQLNDEFRAGGQHPYYVSYRDTRPNNTFSGYPQGSLAGETMLILTGAYRFPLRQTVRKKLGPLYINRFDMQVGGTAGNLWSHQIKQEAIDGGRTYFDSFGQRVALDPVNDIRREVPFMDVAYKNGQRMLFDASAEVRMNSLFWQGGFDSFFRVSYGFNEIKGINDVNGDDISDTSDPGTGNSISQEVEKPGPRFYLGIGTGW